MLKYIYLATLKSGFQIRQRPDDVPTINKGASSWADLQPVLGEIVSLSLIEVATNEIRATVDVGLPVPRLLCLVCSGFRKGHEPTDYMGTARAVYFRRHKFSGFDETVEYHIGFEAEGKRTTVWVV